MCMVTDTVKYSISFANQNRNGRDFGSLYCHHKSHAPSMTKNTIMNEVTVNLLKKKETVLNVLRWKYQYFPAVPSAHKGIPLISDRFYHISFVYL